MKRLICGRQKTFPARHGFALVTVLVFMAFMLVLGTALLITAQHNAVQSGAVYQTDKHYYAAESAVQMASSALITELNRPNQLFVTSSGGSYSNARDTLINRINTICDDIAADLNSFNTERVDVVFDWDPNLCIMEQPEFNGSPGDSYTGSLLLCQPSSAPLPFTISATSGGRTVTSSMNIVAEQVGGERTLDNFGNGLALFEGERTDIYGDLDEDGKSVASNQTVRENQYEEACLALRRLFSDTAGLNVTDVFSPEGSVWPSSADPPLTGGLTNSTLADKINEANAAGSKYIRLTSGDVALTDSGTSSFSGVEYLEIASGNLDITKCDAVFPDLKGLYVNGNVTISECQVQAPKLKGVYIGGSLNFTNTSGTLGFTGRSRGWDPFDPDAPYGTDFLIQNGDFNCSFKNANLIFDWSRYYVQKGNISLTSSAGGTSNLFSNSIFIAAGSPPLPLPLTSGGRIEFIVSVNFVMSSTNNMMPQFYSRGNLTLNVHNQNTEYQGIFGTLSDQPIFQNANKLDHLTGFVVGNCAGVKLGGDVNGLPPEEFATSDVDGIMDGGLYEALNTLMAEGAGGVSGPATAEIRSGQLRTLRETTREPTPPAGP